MTLGVDLMAGLYVRNRLFNTYCQVGMENLPVLEEDVGSDGTVLMTVLENYETALEDGWPDFVRDFYTE